MARAINTAFPLSIAFNQNADVELINGFCIVFDSSPNRTSSVCIINIADHRPYMRRPKRGELVEWADAGGR